MIIKTGKDKLVEATTAVKAALPSKPVLPITNGILIEAKEDTGVIFTATNLESTITFDSPMEVVEPGAIVLHKDFIEIVKKLPDVDIEIITTDETKVIVRYGANEITLNCLDSKDFPELPKVVGEPFTSTLYGKRVAFAAGTDEARPIFMGVLIDFANGKMVSTDTHRLAMVDIEKKDIASVLIPATVFKSIDGEVEVTMATNHVMFKKDRTTFTSAQIAGNFPDYSKVFPQGEKTSVTMDKSQFFGAVDRASILSSSSYIKFGVKDNVVKLEAHSQDTGSIKEEVEIEKVGDEIDIAFNPKYVTQVLPFLKKDKVSVRLNGPLAPAVIEEEDYKYLMLPVRIA